MVDIPAGYKQCSKGVDCVHPDGSILPATTRYFIRRKAAIDGLRGECRVCSRQFVAAGLKYCSKCGNWFPATTEYFRKHSNRGDGLSVWCNGCHNRYIADRRSNDPVFNQKLREYDRTWKNTRYTTDPEYRDRFNRYRRELWASNSEYHQRQLDAHKQWYQERINSPSYKEEYNRRARQRWRERRKSDPEFVERERIRVQRRIARRRELPEDFSLEDWLRLLDYFDNHCAVCGGSGDFHADHWIPQSDDNCPGTIPTNMMVLCASCNLSKGPRDPVEWLIERFGFEQAAEINARIQAYFESL